MAIDEEKYVVWENKRVTRTLLFVDWPEKNFCGQSEAGNSNASGTGSVRVSAKGLISPIFKSNANFGATVLAKTVAPKFSHALHKKFHSCACSFS